MPLYQDIRSKIIEHGQINGAEARSFFEDLYNLSIKRCIAESGTLWARHFPTRQYRGPGGFKNVLQGWKHATPIGICDHFTANDSLRSTVKWFSSYDQWDLGGGKKGSAGASSALVVGIDGEPLCLIDFWNGKSDWHEPQLNGVSVGIEHVNVGEVRKAPDGSFVFWPNNWTQPYKFTRELPPQQVNYRGAHWMMPYTREQILTNLVLKRAIIALYPSGTIRKEMLVDHAMVRDDKKDCGPLWPLAELREMAFSYTPLRDYPMFQQYTPVSGSTLDAFETADLSALRGEVMSSETPQGHSNMPFHHETDVFKVQKQLKLLGYAVITNGNHDDIFVNAVRHFQRDRCLKEDGIVGPNTRIAIEAAVKNMA